MTTVATTPAARNEGSHGKALTVALWVFQIGLALMFFMAGGNKLAGNPMMVGLFDAIGIGQWFRYLTGALEVTGGVLLLVPRASGLGASLLIAVMFGAITTHLLVLHNSPAMPIALLVGLVFVAWGRRAQILSFARRLIG
jgi:putative oxidoreductase